MIVFWTLSALTYLKLGVCRTVLLLRMFWALHRYHRKAGQLSFSGYSDWFPTFKMTTYISESIDFPHSWLYGFWIFNTCLWLRHYSLILTAQYMSHHNSDSDMALDPLTICCRFFNRTKWSFPPFVVFNQPSQVKKVDNFKIITFLNWSQMSLLVAIIFRNHKLVSLPSSSICFKLTFQMSLDNKHPKVQCTKNRKKKTEVEKE